MTEIPKIINEPSHGPEYQGRPGWIQPVDENGKKLRPLIRCNCGWFVGIGLHHVHTDGTVTDSFLHDKASDQERGCGWHVFLKLKDWIGGEFKPEKP